MSEKKKFYKKPAFWIIVVVIVAIVGIAAHQIKQEQEEKEAQALVSSLLKKDSKNDDDVDIGDSGDDDYDDVDTDDDSDSDETYHKVGESTKLDGVTYTLKSVEVTDDRNSLENTQPKYVIKVVYHVKNDTNDELSIGSDLDMYDPDDNKLDTYPISGTTFDTLTVGKEADVITGFSADKLGSFELQFCPSGDDAEPVKFTADVQ